MEQLKDSFLRWFEYNRKANQNFIEIFGLQPELPDDAISIFGHLLNSHLIWLNRIHPLEDIEIPSPWDKLPVKKFASVNQQCYQLSEWYLQDEQFGQTLQKVITYQNSKGKEYQNSIEEIYFHLLSHSAYHRGQMAKQLRRADIEPPVTDYIFDRREIRKMEGDNI